MPTCAVPADARALPSRCVQLQCTAHVTDHTCDRPAPLPGCVQPRWPVCASPNSKECTLSYCSLPKQHITEGMVLCRSLTQMGTEKEGFVQLTERIGRKTGGLSFSPFTAHKRGQVEPQAYLMVRGKVTASKAPDMLDLMRDILLTARLDDKDRFKQVCLPCCHCHLLCNALYPACKAKYAAVMPSVRAGFMLKKMLSGLWLAGTVVACVIACLCVSTQPGFSAALLSNAGHFSICIVGLRGSSCQVRFKVTT